MRKKININEKIDLDTEIAIKSNTDIDYDDYDYDEKSDYESELDNEIDDIDDLDDLDETILELENDRDLSEEALAQKKKIESLDPVKIMALYRQGKDIINSTNDTMRSIYNLSEKAKVPEKYFNIPNDKMSADELKDLKEYRQQGKNICQQANTQMVDKLEMFIYAIINKRFTTFKKYTKDLFQEGVIGILKGIDGYDPTRSKPTTYFYIYILHEQNEFLNNLVNRTTSHYATSIVKIKKILNEFEKDGRVTTVKDIAQETGIPAETVAQALNIMKNSNLVHYENDDFLDSQMSERYHSPEEQYLEKESVILLNKAIDTLLPDEANVIRLKFGLTGLAPMSYKNIAETLNLQIDRVKKYNASGIRKLRKSKIINGNFANLKGERKALNGNMVGIVPVDAGEKLMDELESLFNTEDF